MTKGIRVCDIQGIAHDNSSPGMWNVVPRKIVDLQNQKNPQNTA